VRLHRYIASQKRNSKEVFLLRLSNVHPVRVQHLLQPSDAVTLDEDAVVDKLKRRISQRDEQRLLSVFLPARIGTVGGWNTSLSNF